MSDELCPLCPHLLTLHVGGPGEYLGWAKEDIRCCGNYNPQDGTVCGCKGPVST